jgi:hypothetical protein
VAADPARGLTSTAAGLCRPPHPQSRTSGRRNAPAAARRRGRNAARAPRAGARAASGGCGQGEGVDRPPVSRWGRRAGRDSARLPHPCGGGVGARGSRGAYAPQCGRRRP